MEDVHGRQVHLRRHCDAAGLMRTYEYSVWDRRQTRLQKSVQKTVLSGEFPDNTGPTSVVA